MADMNASAACIFIVVVDNAYQFLERCNMVIGKDFFMSAWDSGRLHHGIFLSVVERLLVCYEMIEKISKLI